MRGEEREPRRLARGRGEHVADGDEVAGRLRHLLAIDGDEAVMQPVAGERLAAMRRDALRDFVLVVRKDEVEAAAMDVEGLAEMRLAHRRALDMPARPAAAPRARPAGQRLGRGLPQHEIGGIALEGRDLDPGAGDHLVARAAGEDAVIRLARDREQHVMLGDIGVARGDEPLDHGEDRGDVLGRARLDIGRQRQEGSGIVVELGGGALGQLADRYALRLGGGVDLVVDVGDVAHVAHMSGAIDRAQHAVEHVERDDRAGVADMRQVIDRRPAHIHADIARVQGREPLLAARERVVEDEGHGLERRALSARLRGERVG